MVTLFTTSISGPIVTGGGVCTMAHFDLSSDTDRNIVAETITEFWQEIAPYLDTGVTFQVDDFARRVAATTGQLQEVHSLAAQPTVPGTVSGSSVPRASQALVQWVSDDVEGGRRIRGRNYIPGVAAVNLSDHGALSATVQAAIAAAANTLLDNTNQSMVIWRRPAGARPGSEHMVRSASVWDQMAILRSRRD